MYRCRVVNKRHELMYTELYYQQKQGVQGVWPPAVPTPTPHTPQISSKESIGCLCLYKNKVYIYIHMGYAYARHDSIWSRRRIILIRRHTWYLLYQTIAVYTSIDPQQFYLLTSIIQFGSLVMDRISSKQLSATKSNLHEAKSMKKLSNGTQTREYIKVMRLTTLFLNVNTNNVRSYSLIKEVKKSWMN